MTIEELQAKNVQLSEELEKIKKEKEETEKTNKDLKESLDKSRQTNEDLYNKLMTHNKPEEKEEKKQPALSFEEDVLKLYVGKDKK